MILEFLAKNAGPTTDLKLPVITCNGLDEDVNTKILTYLNVKGVSPIVITDFNSGAAQLDYFGKVFRYVHTDTYTPLCLSFSL